MREHLAAEAVARVVMEATGDRWKPFCYRLEDLPGVEVMLVTALHVKNLPGRKAVVADADLAQNRLRAKIPQLNDEMVPRFNKRHGFRARLHISSISTPRLSGV